MDGNRSTGPDVEVLAGGISHAGRVVRVGDEVHRPAGPFRDGIHALLRHAHAAGFDGVPEVLGMVDDEVERLRYIEGRVPMPPYEPWSQTDGALASAAALLRRFHEAVVGFVPPVGVVWSDEMADPEAGPDAIICHNDVCPENLVYRGEEAVAVLDFEFAAPGRPEWDLAALARMCGPIDPPEIAARTGREDLDPVARLRVAADGYGLDSAGRAVLLDALTTQLGTCGAFVRRRVEAGDEAFVLMWEYMGGQARYDDRLAWFLAVRPRFEAALGV